MTLQEHIDQIWQVATLAERERCIKVCEDYESKMWALYKGRAPYKGDEPERASDLTQGQSIGAGDCAEAIRKGE